MVMLKASEWILLMAGALIWRVLMSLSSLGMMLLVLRRMVRLVLRVRLVRSMSLVQWGLVLRFRVMVTVMAEAFAFVVFAMVMRVFCYIAAGMLLFGLLGAMVLVELIAEVQLVRVLRRLVWFSLVGSMVEVLRVI